MVRKIFPPGRIVKDSKLHRQITAPTKIYVKSILETNNKFKINGWAHITGSGLFGKLGKIIPLGLSAELKRGSWEIPEIFSEIQKKGQISENEMFSTFNMGVGFSGVVSENSAEKVIDFLKKKGEEVYVIGKITKNKRENKAYLT